MAKMVPVLFTGDDQFHGIGRRRLISIIAIDGNVIKTGQFKHKDQLVFEIADAGERLLLLGS
jgi:hypothetical protein